MLQTQNYYGKLIALISYCVILVISLSLTACQSTLIRTDSSYFEPSPRSTIEITQSLSVSPNSARIYLQNGEPVFQGRLNLYDINCEIEVNTVSEERQTVNPGIFNVLAVIQDQSPIVMVQPIQLASLKYASGGGGGTGNGGGSPVDIKRFYKFRLSAQESDSAQSGAQVRSVICRGAQNEPYKAELPTLEEMKAAAGSYIKFNLTQ